MDAEGGSTADGTQIQEWSCNGSGAQAFRLDDAGGGAFYVVNVQANKCVDVQARGSANGTKIQLWDCNQTPAQTFVMQDAGSGSVYVVNTNSNKCLDVANDGAADGTLVQLYECNQTSAQKWSPSALGASGGAGSGGGSSGGSSSGGTASGGGSSSGGSSSGGTASGGGSSSGGVSAGGGGTGGGGASAPPAGATDFFVHYMAWFQAKPVSQAWGWHWTMNAENPDLVTNGERQIASQFYPSIGPYDSSDPDVLEYHVLLMKYAGIRGALVDWYGIDDPSNLDYGMQTRNASLLLAALKRAGLEFGVVYEDQSLEHEIDLGDIAAGSALGDGQAVMRWLQTNWFADSSYARWNGAPLLLNFGPQFFMSSDQWSQLFSAIYSPPSFFTLHSALAPAASGSFYWPEPSRGTDGDRAEYVTELPHITIPAAYPRFADFYAHAGVGPSYGSIADNGGATYTDGLSLALGPKPPIVQLVTWNDWGEGTQLEPSTQFGTRDLEATQQAVRAGGWTSFPGPRPTSHSRSASTTVVRPAPARPPSTRLPTR